MDAQFKRKVMAKVELGKPRAQVTLTRPVSPLKAPSIASSVSASPAASPTAIRPRAQISGSAKTNTARKPASQPAVANRPARSGALTPRSQSPTKQLEAVKVTVNGRLSPALSTVSRLRSKTNPSSVTGSASSLPPTPRLPNMPTASTSNSATPIPATTSDPILSSTPIRIRHASISSMSEIMASSPQNRLLSPPSSSLSTTHDSDTPSASPMRIKAKVTSIVKAKPSTPVTPSFSPASPPQQQQLPSPTPSINSSPNIPATRRIGRTSSVSSLSAFNPIYPISVSHPSGNPHRFSTQRAASPFRRQPLPFSSPVNSPDKENTNPDPASIPLPPLSPPSSTLSFSSHSSTSRSSLSSTSHTTAPTFQISVDGLNTSPTLKNGWLDDAVRGRANSVASFDPSYERRSNNGDAVMEEERKQKAEAKSNRKIADLEITNSSLLAINASLEASKHKQAKEIRELRKKLRETRLVLPPKVYREMRDNHGSDSFYADERIDDDEDDDEEEGESDNEAEDEAHLGADDATYMRVRALISGLLESGRQALESKPEDFEPAAKGSKVTRVLHEVEARTWRAEAYDMSSDALMNKDDAESSDLSSDEDDIVFDTQGNGSSRSEDEVEEMVGSSFK
ncbi:hypothetical protein SCHPADRAFT_996147 [Schizopora paradoxa]|uniref:Uncharacterized protein n=1 Tax=Schizopora paradoxa TaxID=27342 RepID=A0A0H2RT95_9AGAM|nr:hypothetical protein SCHPADRAFT_996147 [Schizopora paradoxa]